MKAASRSLRRPGLSSYLIGAQRRMGSGQTRRKTSPSGSSPQASVVPRFLASAPGQKPMASRMQRSKEFVMNVQTVASAADLSAIKGRQQIAWGSGDYAVVGTTLNIVGEMLCEAVDLHSDQRVLDVAAGNGNATLAAARRFAYVVSTDYVGALLERGRERAKAERLPVAFQEADAEAL